MLRKSKRGSFREQWGGEAGNGLKGGTGNGQKTDDPSEIGLQKHFTGQAEGRERTEGGNGGKGEWVKRRVGEKGNKGIMFD